MSVTLDVQYGTGGTAKAVITGTLSCTTCSSCDYY